ncbi:chaetoglobosin A biosynthesis cluster protein C-like [Homalodisca vitripennis]|uniref:chaetoglobosin A biosynthesis cluster protein C-like n=1 Tax=Homalodisca vitripennis TaxID=197043 RepID=UPI001EEA38AB|nr:chaetoglobosin A biosynthesis cluster protein C-like [Homalodisca vitripennis]
MPKERYKPEALQAALNDVKNGLLSKKAASKKYGIPRATIQFRLSSKFTRAERGPPPILSKEEEDLLEKWIIDCSKKGFPRRKEDIQLSVQEFLTQNNRPNPFKESLPGIGWYQAFLRRHPKITQRTAEAVTAASTCVSEMDIKNWFSNIESVLSEENVLDILKNPDRIFNGDETNFQMCPKNSKVLAPLGSKNVYEIDKGKAKSAVTAMFTFSASGKVVPPMLIYPYQRLPSAIVILSQTIGASATVIMAG